ncbi:SdpI family protein [Tenacibaculum maritimum]|uniref:SdpI family protein n=1 Tax=Tenacibaculum maritimum TaxID=107401 RepID=UPI0012E6AA4A|nr:SdpI family protein [Tenacibaculum maritimum]CAA0209724.1 hypothetical protein TMP227_350007 [Tenacibaculum maritimum]
METIFKSILTFDIAIFLSLILFYFIKKDTINPIMGYRTKRAMKNQKNWSFAQKYFSKNWLFSIPIILISQVPILFDKTMELVIPISLMNFIIYTVYLIYVTEKKLKEMDEI